MTGLWIEEMTTSSSVSSGIRWQAGGRGRPVLRRGDEGKVEGPAGKFLQQAARAALGQAQVDARIRRMERGQDLGNQADAQRRAGADGAPWPLFRPASSCIS